MIMQDLLFLNSPQSKKNDMNLTCVSVYNYARPCFFLNVQSYIEISRFFVEHDVK